MSSAAGATPTPGPTRIATGAPTGGPAAGPAIGGRGGIPVRAAALRLTVAVACVFLLLGLKVLIADTKPATSTLPPIRGAAQVTAHLLRGGRPTDVDLVNMIRQNHVAAVVDITSPSIAEQASTRYLRLRYLETPVAGDGAPTLAQLDRIAALVRRTGSQGRTVYLHDDDGTERAVATTEMLLLLRGESLTAVRAARTPAEARLLTPVEVVAIGQLAGALATPSEVPAAGVVAGNPYAGARRIVW